MEFVLFWYSFMLEDELEEGLGRNVGVDERITLTWMLKN
jgi:hypothetical protein